MRYTTHPELATWRAPADRLLFFLIFDSFASSPDRSLPTSGPNAQLSSATGADMRKGRTERRRPAPPVVSRPASPDRSP